MSGRSSHGVGARPGKRWWIPIMPKSQPWGVGFRSGRSILRQPAGRRPCRAPACKSEDFVSNRVPTSCLTAMGPRTSIAGMAARLGGGGPQFGHVRAHCTGHRGSNERDSRVLRPGVRIGELQEKTQRTYQQMEVPQHESVLTYFHGLGLSIPMCWPWPEDGSDPNWRLEEGMVIAAHLLCPGNQNERCWIEEVFVVKEGGTRAPLHLGQRPLGQRIAGVRCG